MVPPCVPYTPLNHTRALLAPALLSRTSMRTIGSPSVSVTVAPIPASDHQPFTRTFLSGALTVDAALVTLTVCSVQEIHPLHAAPSYARIQSVSLPEFAPAW